MSDEPVRRPRTKSWADLFDKDDKDDKDEAQGYLSQFAELTADDRKIRLCKPDPVAQNNMMFILLAETSSEPHFIKDLSLKYIYVNRAMERLLKRPQKDIVGLRDEQLFSHEEATAMRSACRSALKGRIVHEEFVRRIGGLSRTFVETLVPWKDRTGNVVAIFGTWVDITDHPDFLPQLETGDVKWRSAATRETLTQASLVARVDTTVLLTGESGSGKDYTARTTTNSGSSLTISVWIPM